MWKLECNECGEQFEEAEYAADHADRDINCEEADYRIVWED